jgi:ATP-dependent DNA ligase
MILRRWGRAARVAPEFDCKGALERLKTSLRCAPRKAAFVEPMLLLRAETLPEGDAWQYELKFDGYRALAIKTGGKIQLRSRNDNDFSRRYPAIAKALSSSSSPRSDTARRRRIL